MVIHYPGLSDSEVSKSKEKFGSNILQPPESESFWKALFENFKEPMIIILCFALVLITLLAIFGKAEWYEGVGIAAAVLIATFVSTYSSYRNEQTFQKLQEEASKIRANVFRNNQLVCLDISEIVVGDYILLQPGDRISADGIIVNGSVEVSQKVLDGESMPVLKTIHDSSVAIQKMEIADSHQVFRGTTVEDGEAVMKTLFVGKKTKLGELAIDLKPSEVEGPLKVKLNDLADKIAKFGYIGGIVIALAFFFKVALLDNQFNWPDIVSYFSNFTIVSHDLLTAIVLAIIVIVVVVPEGLPMMIAIVLAINMRKLLKDNVLVRQNVGIETSGSMNILFCDKTGTITKGELEAVAFGCVAGDQKSISYKNDLESIPGHFRSLLEMSIRENSSCVINLGASRRADCILGGNPTEKALAAYIKADAEGASYTGVEVVKQIAFNSTRKFSAVELEQNNTRRTFVKGAPERILHNCISYIDMSGNHATLTESGKLDLYALLDEKAEAGYRMMAFAYNEESIHGQNLMPEDLILIGFVAIRDDLRPEAKDSIRKLQQSGIQVVMLTGDKMGTAIAIAKDVDIINCPKPVILEHSDLEKMSDSEIKNILKDLRIVSRCEPEDKKRLVKLAQEMNLVTGMTGDGVNDSPALMAADIGFGMGSGTEVAKEASQINILDDNISSITKAIHYGRTIYRSIQKFINFQLTVGVSACLIAFLGPFIGVRLPLTMIQLLWVNLIMDTLAALALSGEPPLEKHMLEKTKRRDEPIINGDMWSSILSKSLFIATVSILFIKLLNNAVPGSMFYNNEPAFLTAFFSFFVFLNLFNIFNSRVEEKNLLHHITSNRGFIEICLVIFIVQVFLIFFGGKVFRTTPLPLHQILALLGLAATIIPFDIIRKVVRDLFTDKTR